VKNKIWMVLPAVLMPYVLLTALVVLFFSPRFPWIMESLFDNNALYLLLLLMVFAVLAFVLSAVFMKMSLKRGWDALALAKTAMIVKLIQIPAYAAIFVLGALFALSLITLGFTVLMILADCLTLVMTGLINVAAVILADREKRIPLRKTAWVIVCQFFFCIDVIAAVVFYFQLKKM